MTLRTLPFVFAYLTSTLIASATLVAQPVPAPKPPNSAAVTIGETVRASASKSTVQIAEPFTIRLEATVAPGSVVEFAQYATESSFDSESNPALGVFDVLSVQTATDLPSDDPDSPLRIWSQTLSLESLQVGHHSIPAIRVTVRKGDLSRTLTTKPIPIEVQSVLQGDDEPLRKIADPIDPDTETSISTSGLHWTWWVLIGIAVISIAALARFWQQRRNTPLRWCRTELAKLEETSNLESPLNQIAVLREILRTSVSIDRGVFTQSPSTRQLIDACQGIAEHLVFANCERVLKYADQCKFAGNRSSSDNASSANLPTPSSLEKQLADAIAETHSLLDHLGGRQRKDA
ncbi:hypothetical protein SAMN06265222_10346 [Neorhodopirellula lusitana]|uniref:Protein BatD n=1 Tax=Neorhodopirellula lusitana TaxID=445327 RepID=A0ABY1PZX2_9BACT|nr:hypothetical protein [Neorhodopirellula lusitana]SMP50149.1 hypothetical protein SAMN06265222_10346 [Neorhodopirellula lusitana]